MAINRQLKWKDMPGLLIRSQVVAATILFIIAMAKVFTWLIAMKQTSMLLQNAMNAPALAVLTLQMGVDPIQFGVLMVVNLAIGMLTPPVGICLFVSCGISGLPLGQVSRAAMPFVAVAIVSLLIACYWPPLTLWFPSLIYK